MATGQENRRYVFIAMSDLASLDFNCFYQDSVDTVRKNLSDTECAVSYDSAMIPECFTRETDPIVRIEKDGRVEHTTEQALDVINNIENASWNAPIE